VSESFGFVCNMKLNKDTELLFLCVDGPQNCNNIFVALMNKEGKQKVGSVDST
jgi:hypothetical protein